MRFDPDFGSSPLSVTFSGADTLSVSTLPNSDNIVWCQHDRVDPADGDDVVLLLHVDVAWLLEPLPGN